MSEAKQAMQTNVLEHVAPIKVRVTDLIPNDWNPNRQEEHDFNLLKKSMTSDGFTMPIMARKHPTEEGKFQILDGFHRWSAWGVGYPERGLIGLGNTHIDVVVLDVADAQARLITLHMNNRGHERADRVADLLRELAEAGHVELLRDELMMDDVEVSRMLESIQGEMAELAKIEAPQAMLGPEGTGLSALDVAQQTDLSADERRAKQRILDGLKSAEEDAMEARDRETFRLVMVFTDQEADVVKSVLDELAKEEGTGGQAAAVLRLCRDAQARRGAQA